MKKFLLLILCVFAFIDLSAQCTELFISEYLEGSNNNKALEIYNPTNKRVALSAYTVGRFNNGSINYGYVPFGANDFIEAYGTYVIVLDKRVLTASGQDYPSWNGYQVYDTCRRSDGTVIIDTATQKVVFCIKNALGASGSFEPVIGTIYRDTFDLTCRANKFACPVYDVNDLNTQAMTFNGNDAVVLVKGNTINPDGSNILDCVGVIGEDPGTAWKDYRGFDVTKDRTLVRKKEFKAGSGPKLAALRDTFPYGQYISLPNNQFTYLGKHLCECNPSTAQIGQGKCGVTGINELLIDFTMYPNPAYQYLNIIAPEDFQSLEIFNLVGKSMQRVSLKNQNAYDVDLSTFENGVYFVKLSFDNNHFGIQKLIVQKN
jgi:Secretion system C-terminal sorting domain/Lamin Tail Domain